MARHRRSDKRVSRAQPSSRWKKLLLPGGLALAVAAGVATWFFLQNPSSASFAAQTTGGPRLLVDPERIDFGPVQFERMVTARFRLRNVGDQPLRLAVDPRVEAIEGC